VDLANERDVPTLAKLYCESFSCLFEHIGLARDSGPAIIEAQWRSKGKLVLSRYRCLFFSTAPHLMVDGLAGLGLFGTKLVT
jgi:hypothetical protein